MDDRPRPNVSQVCGSQVEYRSGASKCLTRSAREVRRRPDPATNFALEAGTKGRSADLDRLQQEPIAPTRPPQSNNLEASQARFAYPQVQSRREPLGTLLPDLFS